MPFLAASSHDSQTTPSPHPHSHQESLGNLVPAVIINRLSCARHRSSPGDLRHQVDRVGAHLLSIQNTQRSTCWLAVAIATCPVYTIRRQKIRRLLPRECGVLLVLSEASVLFSKVSPWAFLVEFLRDELSMCRGSSVTGAVILLSLC